MAELDQITVSTKRFIAKARRKLVDNIFNVSPFMAYMKENLKEDYSGGRLIQENFLYDTMIGGPYAKGATFNITQKQIEQAGQFVPKFFYTNITLYKEDIQVLNKGTDTQIFDLVQSRTEVAYQNIGAQLAIGSYMQGQSGSFINNMNGLAEALNDNSGVSWDNATYSTYGTITRGGAVGAALSSVPVNVNGTIDYPQLEEKFGNACFGTIEPNLIVTTVLGYSYLKEKFQAQQMYEDKVDLKLGITGMKFNGATILKDRYAPGSYLAGSAGRADVVANGFMDALGGAGTAYPTLAVSSSESLWILNARKPYINFYVSDDPEFGFGFTGFKPAQDNNTIAGQILFAGNMTVPGPRYHIQMHGITG